MDPNKSKNRITTERVEISLKTKMKTIKTSFAEKTVWKMTEIMSPANMVAISSLAAADKIEKIRLNLAARGQKAPSYTAIVLKATALVMKRHPEANRAILGPFFYRRLYQFENIDVSVAVEKSLTALPGQPYAATVISPLKKSLQSITSELRDLSFCTEETDKKFKLFMFILRRIPSPWSLLILNAPYWFPSLWVKYRGCAAWVNSPAKAGADLVITCWPWPMTFSFGIVKKRPLVVDNKVEAVTTIPLLMSFDRRIMGGGPASRVFATYLNIIESADEELFTE